MGFLCWPAYLVREGDDTAVLPNTCFYPGVGKKTDHQKYASLLSKGNEFTHAYTWFTIFHMISGKSKENDFYRLQLVLTILLKYCCSFQQQKSLSFTHDCPKKLLTAL